MTAFQEVMRRTKWFFGTTSFLVYLATSLLVLSVLISLPPWQSQPVWVLAQAAFLFGAHITLIVCLVRGKVD